MTLKELRLPLLAVAASTLFAAALARATVTETFAKTYPLASDGSIRLENVNGSIEITGWDKNEVSLEAETRAKTDEDLKKVHLRIEDTPNTLSIKAEYEKKSGWFGGTVDASVHFKLMVPAGARLEKIESVNSDIMVAGIRGPVRLATVNGRVQATGLAADTKMESVNGRLDAEFASVGAAGEVKLESVNGSVELVLPHDAGANLRTSTVNGGISVEQAIKLSNSSHHNLAGQIGTGGPAVSIETVNGGIKIREK